MVETRKQNPFSDALGPYARHTLSAEKIAAIVSCMERGLTVNAAALEIGCNRKTVMTYRRLWINAELQRAYDVLWDGDGEGCDAITAKLPTKDVKAMLDAWLDDQLGDTPKSHWHSWT